MPQPDPPSHVDGADTRQGGHPILKEADRAFERGDFAQAGTCYMAVAREAPDNGTAWLGLSSVLLMTGQFDRATQLVDRALAPQHKAKAWLALSRVLVTMGEFDRAAQLVDRAIALQPDDLQLWETLITVLEDLRGPEFTIEYLERHHDTVPKDLTLDLHKVRLYVSTGQLEEAETHMHSVVDANLDTFARKAAFASRLLEENPGTRQFPALTRALLEATGRGFTQNR